MPPNNVPLELTRVMAIARSRAFQALKMEQDEKDRQKKLRGEHIEQDMEEGPDTIDLAEAAQYSSEWEDEAEMDSMNDEDVESDQQDDEEQNSEPDDNDEAV
jgi:hypothetical protein